MSSVTQIGRKTEIGRKRLPANPTANVSQKITWISIADLCCPSDKDELSRLTLSKKLKMPKGALAMTAGKKIAAIPRMGIEQRYAPTGRNHHDLAKRSMLSGRAFFSGIVLGLALVSVNVKRHRFWGGAVFLGVQNAKHTV